MKLGTIFFLKSAVIFIGLIVLCLSVFVLPGLAEFSASANPEFAHLKWPVLLGMYMTLVPFLLALYQAYKLLGLIKNKHAFSEGAVNTLKQIKMNAIIIALQYLTGAVLLLTQKALHPGVAILGMVIIFASVTISMFTSVLQKLLNHALDAKSEHDLTV
ncbi:DUF2975 domain-containing protein [Rossellomorea sp. NS-SX7]|uniref:DUF2975 domain-containing protein n=1 Tax=Rossellomorea sp. NS-SX7 TaxID=3463856 RepID=UPI0040599C61